MPKFFDQTTKILYNVVDDRHFNPEKMIRVVEYEYNDSNLPGKLTLRRQLGGYDFTQASLFFSATDKQIHKGIFDLDDKSNNDLIPVKQTVSF